VPEKVTISYRGAKYELGRGKRYYGIWIAGAPVSDPLDRWPETRDGWTQAWQRFTSIETPGTITAARKPRAGLKLSGVLPKRSRPGSAEGGTRPGLRSRAMIAAGLLGLGVVLGVIGLFPGYVEPKSLVAQADQLVPHLIYLVAWAACGVLIALGGAAAARPAAMSPAAMSPAAPGQDAPRPAASRFEILRLGALLGTGLSAVTLGLFLADLGEVISGSSALLGPGLVLTLLSWLACTAGSVLALTARPVGQSAAGGPAKPRPAHAGPVALLLLAAIGAVAAFVPAWDSFTLSQSGTGATQTITAGNAFDNPGAMIAGDVVVMIAVIAVAVLAALWRPVRHGAVLLAGATIPLAAQAISALIQVSEPASPAQFGISPNAGVTITSGVTPIFWVYCVFVISLVVSCAWMLTAPHYPAMPAMAQPPAPAPPQPSQAESSQAQPPQAQPQGVDDAADDSDHAGDSAVKAGDSDGGAEDDAKSTYA
jgi:hypothetical protein